MSEKTVILDGKELSAIRLERLCEKVSSLDVAPQLVVVLVGNDPASKVYVGKKEKTAVKVGMRSRVIRLEEETTETQLLSLIDELNQDDDVTGILVQLPLPSHIDEKKVICAIDPQKDVDGFHPVNLGRLLAGDPGVVPCTPKGIMEFFDHYEIPLEGKSVVIVGRSNIVGKPLVPLFLMRNATPTICHSRTRDLVEVCSRADVLVAAIGRAKFITADFVKQGAVVIDVGINRVEGKLCGDLDFESVKSKCSAITPVPGGVGPMTVSMLLENTLELFLSKIDNPCQVV